MIKAIQLTLSGLALGLLLTPLSFSAQSADLSASPTPLVVSFHGQRESLSFHTSCSSPPVMEPSANQALREGAPRLFAVLTRGDGSVLGRVDNIECPVRGEFSDLDTGAGINAAGEATIFVNGLPQGSLEPEGGRVTLGRILICERRCKQGGPVVLDGAVIEADTGETRANLRFEREKVYVLSYQTSGAD